ncbi:MAG: flavin reductase family protein [Chloroflexi bacterium]|nr:flavin reductase family protein [Chloroflexota bacterium]
MSVDTTKFRQVMGRFAKGVTIVTVRVGDDRHGMTVSAFTSLSLEPPLVLVCIARKSRTHQLIAESGAFAVNILRDRQQPLAELFARPWDGTSRFHGIDCRDGPTGSPLIPGCLAYVDCHVAAAYPGGDHTIYVGEVVAADLGDEGDALLFHRSRYRRLPSTE